MAALETFANNPSTTVTGGGTDAPAQGTPQVWTVFSSSGFPAAATGVTQFHIGDPAAPSEIILVTSVLGTSWSVVRGAEGSPTVPHTAGFTVVQVVTAGWLGSVTTGSFVNPMTTGGDTIFGAPGGTAARRAGNITTAKQFLTSTGSGGTANAPVWGTIAAGDVPVLNQNTTGTAGSAATAGTAAAVSGTVTTAHGGTGLGSLSTYAVVTGGTSSTSPVQQVATAGTVGQVLTSQGPGVLPSWADATGGSGGTVTFPITVPEGGFGGTQATAYAVLAGGTTATAPFQQVGSLGSAGQILTSRGAGSLPSWQSNAGGSVGTGAAGQVLTSAVPAGGGSPVTGWQNAPVDWLNVQTAYGAAGNGVFTTAGTITSASHTFHSSDLVPFTGSLNVWIDGAGAAGGVLSTTMTCTVPGTGTTAAAASTTATGTNALWGTDDTTAIRNAINAAPFGGVVYFPVAVYITSSPLVVPPCVTLLSDGRSLAYYGGSQNMQMSNAILHPSPVFAAGAAVATGGGTQATTGVIEFLSQNLGGYSNGSSNQAVRNITIDGRSVPGSTFNGIEAYGPVWGVLLEYAGIFGLPKNGILANSSAADATGKFPDVWQVIGCHMAANGSDGVGMSSISDSYFVASESTGNNGNGWTLTGDNIKIVGCKAEYNNGIGLTIGRGGSSRPILIDGFGTDGNGQNGIQITGAGAGPVVINGAGLNYDGTSGSYGALEVTSGGHVDVTGLFVTTQNLNGGTHPTMGVQIPSTFTGVLQIENSEIYAGGTVISVDPAATGTVVTGTNVRTGIGNWGSQPTITSQVWQPAAGLGGGFGQAQPSNHNLVAWTFDPALSQTGFSPVSGTQYLSSLYVSQNTTISNVYWDVNGTATTITSSQNFIGLVNSSGVLLNSTAAGAIDATLASTGLKTTALGGTVFPGQYWVLMLFNYSGAASLKIGGLSNAQSALPNVGLSPAGYRYATCGATKTNLSNFPIATSSNTLSATTFWAAIG